MRTLLANLAGKLTFSASRTLNLGGGSAAPGLIALKIDQNYLSHQAPQIPQNIIITGTNGKTTTSRILTQLLEKRGLRLIRNTTGSNLQRGLASALLKHSNFSAQISNIDLGLWELDEAAFNTTVFSIKPQIIVFLNVFRDQLDRYGEVDNVVKAWQETLGKIDWDPLIIVNGDDGNTLGLVSKKFRSLIFRVKNQKLKWEKKPLLRKLTGKNLIEAKIIKNFGLDGVSLKVKLGKIGLNLKSPLPGVYHVYDLLGALCIYQSLDLPLKNIQQVLSNFTPAFGRVEKIRLDQTLAYICLIKNPAGASSVFETISPEFKRGDNLLLALNDNFADGRDVSWIWDGEFEKLKTSKTVLSVICSGKRATELAVRLKYAGFTASQIKVYPDLKQALQEAKRDSKRLFILPTYTALLELQKVLSDLRVKSRYWRQE